MIVYLDQANSVDEVSKLSNHPNEDHKAVYRRGCAGCLNRWAESMVREPEPKEKL